MKKLTKKLVCVIAIAICISVIFTSTTLAEGSISLIGTNQALGSPLLDGFQLEDWDQWELAVFGIFLSNFVNPFVDDYESAFSTSSSMGSKGAGLKALQFGSGNDPSNNKILQELLRYAINVQKDVTSLKPIDVQYQFVKFDEAQDYTEPRQAKVKDLFVWTTSGLFDQANWELDAAIGGKDERGKFISGLKSRIAKLQEGHGLYTDPDEIDVGIIEVGVTLEWEKGIISDWEEYMYGAKWGILPKFNINLMNGNKQTVLDYKNGWDIQMISAWISKTFNGPYKDYIDESTFAEFLECNLYLDIFGNIVALKDGRNYMIFPVAANQYVTSTPSYNLVQSVLFGGQYLDASDDILLLEGKELSIITYKTSTGMSALSGGNLDKGKIILCYDSNSILYRNAINQIKNQSIPYNEASDRYTIKKSAGIRGDFGKVLTSLLDIKVGELNNNKYGFRVETIKADEISDFSRVRSLGRACNVLSVMYPIDNSVKVLDYVMYKNTQIDLLGKPVIISPKWSNVFFKMYPNYLYEHLTSDTEYAGKYNEDWGVFKNSILTANTKEEAFNKAITGYDDRDHVVNNAFKNYLMTSKYIKKDKNADSLDWVKLEDLHKRGYKLSNGKKITEGESEVIHMGTETMAIESPIDDSFSRWIKAYTYSPIMRQVNNVLSVREGTEFALWSPFIYITYLDWYGILGDGAHNLNENIYEKGSNLFSFDIEQATKGLIVSEEEKKKSIIDYTYLLLHPEAGREYRSDVMMDGFTSWVYRSYQRIVYGKAVDFYATNYTANRYGGGFLKIDTYSENFMTSWFIGKYTEYIVVLIAILSILIVLVGIITRKKLIWFFVSFLVMVNVMVLTPAVGEITPYIVNNTVQRMFNDKMAYWAISEGVTNATIEKKVNEQNKYTQTLIDDKITNTEAAHQIANLVKTLNIAYLDRALMLKLDISKKITDTQLYSYDEVQKLQSARWLLPIMIRQFTASDGSANYVYVPLADVFDNLTNMYWKIKPSDKISSETANSVVYNNANSTYVSDVTKDTYQKQQLYAGYKDTSYIPDEIKDKIILADSYKNQLDAESWMSRSRVKNDKYSAHTFFYMLDGVQNLPQKVETTWEEYVYNNLNNSAGLRDSIIQTEDIIETYAGLYNYSDPNTVQNEFGFLWNTENPLHYFYQVVKDTFEPDIKLAVLAGELQGELAKNRLTGEEVRKTFMHYSDTGKIKDFLDMQELFTNVLPYMYSMQVLSGGADGRSGIFGDEKIEKYSIYENNYKSWLFRSNWVTKLMESGVLTQPAEVISLDGRLIRIENPMDPNSYIEASGGTRPMIFSEAQMYALGLNEKDLTTPELKILNVNKAVERRWTLLLNYVNVPGITKEVLYRQMAIEALMEFNKEFTTSNTLNSAMAMYPTGLDLRNISFDSIMKMLMLNTTKDTRFIYGDTMLRVIENSDEISAALILVGAFLCSYIIPLARNVLMGLLFYLGIIAVISNVVAGNKAKLKITTAFVLNNLIFLMMTVIYYGVFAFMINVTYKDDVLTVSNIVINVGNPIWVFILIVFTSCLYIFGCYLLINFTLKNYRDLGFEAYAAFASILSNRISEGVSDVGGRIAEAFSANSSEYFGGYGSSGSGGRGDTAGRKVSRSNSKVTEVETQKNRYDDTNKQTYDSAYTTGDVKDNSEANEAKQIDREIEKGKKM